MKLKILKIGIILCVMMMSSGCWDFKEMENMYYILTMGVDYKNGEYIVHVKLINFSALKGAAKGDGGGGGGQLDQAEIGIGKGITVAQALHDLYIYTQREIYFGHLSAVVLSENALKHSMQEALESLKRFRAERGTIWVFATKEPMNEVLSNLPVLEHSVILSLLGEPETTYKQSSLVKPIQMFELQKEIHEPGMTVAIPNINISENRWYTEKKSRSQIGINGIHFMQNNQWKAYLSEADILGLRWKEEDTERAPVTIVVDKEEVATLIMKYIKFNITVEPENDHPLFTISIKAGASIYELFSDITEEQLEKETEKTIKKQMQDVFQKGVEKNTDVFQLSYHLYRKDQKLWEKVTKDGELKLSPDLLSSIEVDVHIEHSGENKLQSY